MRIILFIISLLIIGGCTSFQLNSDGVKRACKSGVETYDDGTLSFKCFEKDHDKK